MTDEEMAKESLISYRKEPKWAGKMFMQDENICYKDGFLAGLKAGRPKWHKRLERPKGKINALCFDIEQNKFILGFYDLEADEWLRYGGYETIYIDLWTKIEIPEFIKE